MELQVAGQSYPLVSAEILYLLNGPATAECSLSVGFKNDQAGTLQPGLLGVARGTPAKIVMNVSDDLSDPISHTKLLTGGTQVAFSGLVDTSGPSNLNKGNFNLRVRLVSSLAVLQTGALQLSSAVASSFLDTGQPVSPTGITEIAVGTLFDPSKLSENFWAELQRVMTAIATNGVQFGQTAAGGVNTALFADFQRIFGTTANTAAAGVLATIQGSLVPGPFAYTGLMIALAKYLNTQWTSDYHMQSFYNRIVAEGQEFKFKMVEAFNGAISVVPYSPFFPASLATPVYPSTVTDMTWTQNEPNCVIGVALTLSGNAQSARSTPTTLLGGTYLRPGSSAGNPLGTIVSIPMPQWLTTYKDQNGISVPAVLSAQLKEQVGDPWAKETALELAYRGYTLHLMCPLRTDLGIGTAVHVLYPTLPGSPETTSVYGSVQAVRLCMDAVKKQAYTLIEVGFVRSDTLQTTELADYTHPVWSTQYAGGRLDGGSG
jgi:hypothetical protein